MEHQFQDFTSKTISVYYKKNVTYKWLWIWERTYTIVIRDEIAIPKSMTRDQLGNILKNFLSGNNSFSNKDSSIILVKDSQPYKIEELEDREEYEIICR